MQDPDYCHVATCRRSSQAIAAIMATHGFSARRQRQPRRRLTARLARRGPATGQLTSVLASRAGAREVGAPTPPDIRLAINNLSISVSLHGT
jgi:hypothetical protein